VTSAKKKGTKSYVGLTVTTRPSKEMSVSKKGELEKIWSESIVSECGER
jgi:hypothetical protein